MAPSPRHWAWTWTATPTAWACVHAALRSTRKTAWSSSCRSKHRASSACRPPKPCWNCSADSRYPADGALYAPSASPKATSSPTRAIRCCCAPTAIPDMESAVQPAFPRLLLLSAALLLAPSAHAKNATPDEQGVFVLHKFARAIGEERYVIHRDHGEL